MKKITALLAFISLISISAFAAPALAHPAKNLAATWDPATNTLTVTAIHDVKNPTKHFILVLSVHEGTKQIFAKQYDKQSDTIRFSDKVNIKGVVPGAKLRVQLMCNIMGIAETTITAR